jgi:hypothetical protein
MNQGETPRGRQVAIADGGIARDQRAVNGFEGHRLEREWKIKQLRIVFKIRRETYLNPKPMTAREYFLPSISTKDPDRPRCSRLGKKSSVVRLVF